MRYTCQAENTDEGIFACVEYDAGKGPMLSVEVREGDRRRVVVVREDVGGYLIEGYDDAEGNIPESRIDAVELRDVVRKISDVIGEFGQRVVHDLRIIAPLAEAIDAMFGD